MEPAHGRADGKLIDARPGAGPAAQPGKGVRPANWLGAGVVGFLLLAWAMGAFDVFLVQQGLGFAASHTCYRNLFGTVYCEGPWSTSPLPDGAVETPSGVRLP